MRFVEQVGGTASIVVNFATGTPREAASWVRYMNGRVGTSRWANLRARHGHPRPYGVKWWEIANEPWLPWQDGWMAGAGVGATSASEAERYAFGGTTRFEREPVGTRCDRRPSAALGDGRPGQVKYADSDYLRSLDHALHTASQLIHFAELRVPLAGRHTLVDFRRVHPSAGLPSPTGFSVFGFAPSFTPSASTRVLELFSHMTGSRQVSAELSGNPIRAGYPALASRGRRGRVSLIVVNRDPERSIAARVALGRSGRLEAWTVDGPATTSFNTPKRPNAVSLRKTSRRRTAGSFDWTFPAHSVTALVAR
jgi:hypothetical protein